MPARGLTRFIFLAVVVLGTIYFFAHNTSSIPSEWTSAIKSSADAFYPIAPDSPAFPNKDLGQLDEVVNPHLAGATPIPAQVKSEISPEDEEKLGKPLAQEDILRIADSPPELGHDKIVNTAPQKVGATPEIKAPYTPPGEGVYTGLPDHYIYNDIDNVHRIVSSVSTTNKRYFPMIFGSATAYNPNIIPHRTLNDTFVIVAQEYDWSVEESVWFVELVCNAKFKNDKLVCLKEPVNLPISGTYGTGCTDEVSFFGFNVGPHDARLFYGPMKPMVLYGSNSAHTCFGQWVQDFRMLTDWGFDWNIPKEFRTGTEIQRPGKYARIEKNWFLFWDAQNELYAHYDLTPKRAFAKVNDDGSVSGDLATSAIDEKCLNDHLPKVTGTLESIHQATNSLSITLCQRSDKSCIPNDKNTFIFTIFHHKSYYAFHSNYEPYVLTFQQNSPFTLHAIGQKPIWINGRGTPGQGTPPHGLAPGDTWYQTEMFYITSISWAAKDQKYHGYIDDVLFMSFGIEDQNTGGIDILAGELFRDLAYCATS